MNVSGTYDATTGDVVAMMNGKRVTGTVVREGHAWHVFPDGEDVRAFGTEGTGETCGRHMYTLRVPIKDYSGGSGGSGALTVSSKKKKCFFFLFISLYHENIFLTQ